MGSAQSAKIQIKSLILSASVKPAMRVLSARAVLSVTFVLLVLQNTLSIKVAAMPVDRLQTV